MSDNLYALPWLFIIIDLVFSVRANFAVKGSYQHYKALTIRRIASWAMVGSFAFFGILNLIEGQVGLAVIWLIGAGANALLEHHLHKDDDDWFKGRKKKLKKWAKKKLAALAPKPLVTPAFG